MIALLNEEVAIASALPLTMIVAQLLHAIYKRYSTFAKTQCISRIARMVVAPEEPSDNTIRSLRMRYTSGTIIEATTFISEHIYGNARYRLSLIAEVCQVDRSSSWNHLQEVVASILNYPEAAIRYIARISTPLSWHEVALLSQLMHQAGTSMAYTPLLMSDCRNLQLMGIYLCEHLSIVDAEVHLQRLCEAEDMEVSYMALRTLCSTRGNITTPQTRGAIARLSPHQRASLLRHLVWACYSLRSCSALLNREERIRFTQRQNSYKCQIVCN